VATRAEHRRNTLLRLGDAAIEQFDLQGPSATINDIARSAGVSRRTVFRYVEAKEELAFVHPMLWFDVFDAALVEAADERLVDRLRFASRAIAAHIDADPEPPRRAFTVAIANPELLRGFTIVFQRWIDRVAAEVLADSSTPGGPTAEEQFRSRIIGSAVMGVVDAVTREWLMVPGASFSELYERGLCYIDPLLHGAAQP
jgi:AcrR family transcriptional regulator